MRHLLVETQVLKNRLIYTYFFVVVAASASATSTASLVIVVAVLLCVLSALNKTSHAFTHFIQIKQISLHHLSIYFRDQLLYYFSSKLTNIFFFDFVLFCMSCLCKFMYFVLFWWFLVLIVDLFCIAFILLFCFIYRLISIYGKIFALCLKSTYILNFHPLFVIFIVEF